MERRDSILLVEDEGVLRRLVAQFLRGEGYLVTEAADGGEGLERFEDSGPFDLILLDLNMPVVHGTEVCRRIKLARPDQAVIICSAAVMMDHAGLLLGLGVAHCLSKPYHPAELLALVRDAIHGAPAAGLAHCAG